jgi:D-alanyl-D-alanine carboxypeptidase (penicillin-binding protein 5/6)
MLTPTNPPTRDNSNRLLFAVVGLIFVFSFVIVFARFEKEKQLSVEVPLEIDTYSNLNLEANSVYILDLKDNKVLYHKNESMQWPMASLTKIMSAIVALEEAPTSLSVRTQDELLADGGGGDARSGEWWNLRDLIDFSLVASSNDGMQAIASAVGAIEQGVEESPEEAFISKMNSKARTLSLSQTYFINAHGLDISEEFSGSYGSARDTAILISYAYKKFPSVMETTSYPSYNTLSESGITHDVLNTNEIAPQLAGLSASKTGLTDLAGGNLAVVFEAGPMHPVAIVVMGSSKEGRFSDIKKLYDATLQYIKLN